ncbi:hypothetical protein [Pseudomonas sp. TMP25]|uniref:hypothetical protein n=1 Tax=Pseudomonas sp. TMP25 TaxID=3136561 RepID=UPI003100D8CA
MTYRQLARLSPERSGGQVVFYASPRFFDPDVALFYVEEAFASSLPIVRFLTGLDLDASHIDLQHPAHKPGCTPSFVHSAPSISR